MVDGTEEGIETLIIPKKPKFQTEEEVNATTLGRAEIGNPLPGRSESAAKLNKLIRRMNFLKECFGMANPEEARTLFNQRIKEIMNHYIFDKEKFGDYVRDNRSKGGRMGFLGGGSKYNKMVTEMYVKSGGEKELE